MSIPYVEYIPEDKDGFDHLTRLYAVGSGAIQIANQRWRDNAGPMQWFDGAGHQFEIKDSIRENAGILCGPGPGEDAVMALRISLTMAKRARDLLMPACVLLLEEYQVCDELTSISKIADLYPYVFRALQNSFDIPTAAEMIREIVNDFGKANHWASVKAYQKGDFVRSEETIELAEMWSSIGNFDYRVNT